MTGRVAFSFCQNRSLGKHNEISCFWSRSLGNHCEISYFWSRSLGKHNEISCFWSTSPGKHSEISYFGSRSLGKHSEISYFGSRSLGKHSEISYFWSRSLGKHCEIRYPASGTGGPRDHCSNENPNAGHHMGQILAAFRNCSNQRFETQHCVPKSTFWAPVIIFSTRFGCVLKLRSKRGTSRCVPGRF